jgi:hypothetical protein
MRLVALCGRKTAMIDQVKSLGWIVAYLAFGMTILNFIYSYFIPFSPNPSFGGILLISKSLDPKRIDLKLALPVTLYNSGSRGGMINDISIKMERTDSNDFVAMFFPAMFFDSLEMVKAKQAKNPDLLSLKEMFTAIYLPPKQYVHKEILFYMETKKIGTSLEPGKYRFSIFIQEPGKQFGLVDVREEFITQDTINNLGNETITVLMPYPDRDKFTDKQVGGNRRN